MAVEEWFGEFTVWFWYFLWGLVWFGFIGSLASVYGGLKEGQNEQINTIAIGSWGILGIFALLLLNRLFPLGFTFTT